MARLIGKDVALFSISGTDVLALYSSATLSFTANEVNLTAAKDEWEQSRVSTRSWEITCTKFIEATSDFMTMIVTGGQAVVSCDIGGSTFSAKGNVVSASISTGTDAQSEDCTIRNYGDTPSIS